MSSFLMIPKSYQKLRKNLIAWGDSYICDQTLLAKIEAGKNTWDGTVRKKLITQQSAPQQANSITADGSFAGLGGKNR